MALSDAIAHIDAQIAILQQARALLSSTPAPIAAPVTAAAPAPAAAKTGRRGRPKGSKNTAKTAEPKAAVPAAGKPRRKLSPEARKAIAEAQKRRWAEHRKTQAA